MKSLLLPRSTMICFIKFDNLYNNGKYGVKKSITKIQEHYQVRGNEYPLI